MNVKDVIDRVVPTLESAQSTKQETLDRFKDVINKLRQDAKDPLNAGFSDTWHYHDDPKSYENVDDPVLRAFMQYKSSIGDDADARMTWYQQYIQYLLGEQNDARNYERSLAVNQVALMQQAGMSRAAALAALQGGSASDTSQTQITPQATDIEGHKTARMNSIFNIVQGVTQMANQIVSLASAPFDIKAKSLTNKLLTNQADMLGMQVEGMQDAAMFMQAVANQDANLREGEKPVADMSVNEQLAFFENMSGKAFRPLQDKVSSWQYAQSIPFQRAKQNPFFWAALNETIRDKNLASASVFEPARAQAEVSRLRAAARLTADESFTEQMRGKILSNDAFISEYTAQARKDMELVKIACEKAGYAFDGGRARAFLERLEDFTSYDFDQLDYNINRLASINDPAIFEQERSRLVHSLDYQIANYIYGSSLVSAKNGVLQSYLQPEEDGTQTTNKYSLGSNAEFTRWTKNYLRYVELGQDEQVNAATNIARTVFGGVSSAGIASYAGYKIYSALSAAKSAAAAAGSAIQSGMPSQPFNIVAPLILPLGNATPQIMNFQPSGPNGYEM